MSDVISLMKLEAQLINSHRTQAATKLEAFKSFVNCARVMPNIPTALKDQVIASVQKQVWDNGTQFKAFVRYRNQLQAMVNK